MNVEVVLLPEYLKPGVLVGKTAVIFDVLRATTTIAAALNAGVREIRLFSSIEAVLAASPQYSESRVRCGERKCLRPEGFELGNSPNGFNPSHRDKVVYMATTNGTKAILAAREASVRIAGALVNCSAVADVAVRGRNDVVLLCAGTGGAVSMEDVIGTGAVAEAIVQRGAVMRGDIVRMAVRLFHETRVDLVAALSEAEGGRNVIDAGLTEDIAFAAGVDSIGVVGMVQASGGDAVLRRVE